MNRRNFVLTATAAMMAAPSVLRAHSDMFETNAVIDVPGDYNTLQEAWTFLKSRPISDNAWITVRLGPGTHQFDRLFAPEHYNGDRIVIEGVSGQTRLEWINDTGPTGIRLSRGRYLRRLKNVTIAQSAPAVWPHNSPAIFLRSNSGIELEDVTIEGFAYGAMVSQNSYLFGLRMQVYDALDVGLYGNFGGMIELRDCLVDGVAEPGNRWGWGFKTETSGQMFVRDSTARNCLKQGFAAQGNSSGKAVRCHSEFNGQGYGCIGNSVLSLIGCTEANNPGGAYITHSGGQIKVT